MGLSLKFDKLREAEVAQGDNPQQDKNLNDIEYYSEPANLRTICFVLKDGRKKGLNYADLLDWEFLPNESSIKILFRSCAVLLKGQNLEKVFDALFKNQIAKITCTEIRYAETFADDDTIVHEIRIDENP